MTWDIAVIGAGPAGLTAAAELAECGRSVLVVDEQARAGGQYYRQHSAAVTAAIGDHRKAGADLIARAERAGVQFQFGTSVWGVADDGRTLLVSTGDEIGRVDSRNILVATGATERSLPFLGWQLPNVVTVGYAQHLAGEGVRVGGRVLVAGSGPFLLPVACSLVGLGIEVVAVLEEGTPYRPRATAVRTLAHPARLREFAAYRSTLARARVPLRSGRYVASATEDGTGLQVVERAVRGPAEERAHKVDALCIGYGFRPQADLLSLLGCATRTDESSGDQVVVADESGATSVAGVYAAGEVTGIAGVHAALAEGKVVADTILGRMPTAHRRVRRARAFAELTTALYPAPRSLAARAVQALSADGLICRCEAVSAATVRAAVSVGSDQQAVKASTRAGMGPCQGRECSPAVAALCGADAAAFTVRTPLRPVSLAAIAAAAPRVEA